MPQNNTLPFTVSVTVNSVKRKEVAAWCVCAEESYSKYHACMFGGQ